MLAVLLLSSHVLSGHSSEKENQDDCERYLKVLGSKIGKFGDEDHKALPAVNRAFRDVKENCGDLPIDETEEIADITFGKGTSTNPLCMGSFLEVFYQLFNSHFKFLMKDSEADDEARTPSQGFFHKIKKVSHSKAFKGITKVGGGMAMAGMQGGMGGGKAGML